MMIWVMILCKIIYQHLVGYHNRIEHIVIKVLLITYNIHVYILVYTLNKKKKYHSI